MAAMELLIPSATRDQSSRKTDHRVGRISDPLHGNFAATLLAIAGHDLRQPLQLITSAHDLLKAMIHTDQQREELAEAVGATARLARMLGQLIEALTLQEQARDDLRFPVMLRAIFADLTAEFDTPARSKGISLRIMGADGVVLSHPVLLTSMLRNLIRNAIDYTPRGGSVSVSVRPRGPEILIDVRDTGAGIRATALSAIFGAFQRADESRTDGLGLGLFIVKGAADLLGHRIEVQSVEGCGSCFTVAARALQSGASEACRSKRAGAGEWRQARRHSDEPKFSLMRSAV